MVDPKQADGLRYGPGTALAHEQGSCLPNCGYCVEQGDGMEQQALEFRQRPDIWEQMWKNANPDSGRSREQNIAWLMAAFARQLLTEERKQIVRPLPQPEPKSQSSKEKPMTEIIGSINWQGIAEEKDERIAELQRQLEEAQKAINFNSDLLRENAVLQAQLAAMREALLTVEYDQSLDGTKWCSECDHKEGWGHAPNCRKGKALTNSSTAADQDIISGNNILDKS